MDRFQEQLELKLTEFLRCIAAFQFEAHVWIQMGADGYRSEPGFQVQAKETAHMWTRLAAQCRTHLEMAGYAFALDPGFDLIAYLEEERHRNNGLLQEQGIGGFGQMHSFRLRLTHPQYPGTSGRRPYYLLELGGKSELQNKYSFLTVKPWFRSVG